MGARRGRRRSGLPSRLLSSWALRDLADGAAEFAGVGEVDGVNGGDGLGGDLLGVKLGTWMAVRARMQSLARASKPSTSAVGSASA